MTSRPMQVRYDYANLKAQFVAADPPISLRELCRQNDIPSERSSSIINRAREEGWVVLRDERMMKADEKVIEELSAREAKRRLRRIQVEDNAIEAIDESITKMRTDMKRTKKEWTKNPRTQEWEEREVPAVTYRPEQVVQLVDRIKALFGDPAPVANGDPSLAASFNFDFNGDSPEHRALAAQLVAATRGARGSARTASGDSPLPHAPGAGEDQ